MHTTQIVLTSVVLRPYSVEGFGCGSANGGVGLNEYPKNVIVWDRNSPIEWFSGACVKFLPRGRGQRETFHVFIGKNRPKLHRQSATPAEKTKKPSLARHAVV